MKTKLLSAFLCIFLLASASLGISAEAKNDTVARVQALADGIVSYKSENSDGVQEWINGELTEKAGISSEWYILSLSQNGAYDFSSYENALLDYLSENDVGSASSRLKYALCLSAVGSDSEYISFALSRSVGEQGIMSYIFGLHLLNNGYGCDRFTAEQITDLLLSLQNPDGGWGVAGTASDVDVTAMTLQALAPHYTKNENVKNAVDNALSLLSERQLSDGDFSSYGTPNPESTAQVVIALCALGIAPDSDTRFIKNGSTLFDGMEKYLLPDGSFCHKLNGDTSGTATVQALTAYVAYLRLNEGKASLYILDRASPESAKRFTAESEAQTAEKSDIASVSEDIKNETDTPSYKLYASLAILAVCGIVCVILIILKKRSFKNIVAVIIITAICITAVCLTDIKSSNDYYGAEITKENAIGTVTLTIRCDNAVGNDGSEYIPQDGVILDTSEIEIENGDTVYTVLTQAARKYGIQLENNGSADMAYIAGINYLYERDFGELSGWIYLVNGSAPSVGCSEYVLSDGDRVEWHYTLELGNDIK